MSIGDLDVEESPKNYDDLNLNYLSERDLGRRGFHYRNIRNATQRHNTYIS